MLGGLTAALLLLWMLLAYSPLAQARTVEVQGVSGAGAEEIRAALEEAGGSQSTFAVDHAQLMKAVADYPEVATVEVQAHPPLRLDLVVVMRPAVATAQIGGRQVAIAGDGTVLNSTSEASLPQLDPSTGAQTLKNGHLAGGRQALALLAAAPAPLLALAKTMRVGKSGLELELTRGPRLIFGNGSAAATKWAAAATVIADGSAERASYIDLRVPSRPAVGGIGGSRAAGSLAEPPTLTAVTPAAAATAGVAATPQAQAPVTPATAPATPKQSPAASPVASAAPATSSAPATPSSAPSTAAVSPPQSATSAPSGGATVGGGVTP